VDLIELEPVDFRLVPDTSQPGLQMLLIEFASGHTAAIWHRSQKLNLVRMGLVFLGAEFEKLVPPIFLAGDPDEGRGDHTFTGFTQDPVIAAAVQEFFREDLEPMNELEREELERGDPESRRGSNPPETVK
jgi:hypothetical protein